MTDEQLVARAKVGDVDATNELVRRCEPLARWIARRYFLTDGTHDDLMQEGRVGLFKAIRDFDVAGGASFNGFAKLCMERQVITAVKLSTRKKTLMLSSAASGTVRDVDGDDLDLLDVFEAPNTDPVELLDGSRRIRIILSVLAHGLSALERDVLDRFLAGASHDEIQVALGIPYTTTWGRAHSNPGQLRPKAVENALQRARLKITHALREDESLPLGAAA